MRLVKLSTAEFESIDKVDKFFDHDLRQREPHGRFLFPRGWIAEDGLAKSELLLFSFLGRVVRVARAKSGRLRNTDVQRGRYPYYFVVDMETVQKGFPFTVTDLEEALRRESGVTKSVAASRGWVRLPDTDTATHVVRRLGRLKQHV